MGEVLVADSEKASRGLQDIFCFDPFLHLAFESRGFRPHHRPFESLERPKTHTSSTEVLHQTTLIPSDWTVLLNKFGVLKPQTLKFV